MSEEQAGAFGSFFKRRNFICNPKQLKPKLNYLEL